MLHQSSLSYYMTIRSVSSSQPSFQRNGIRACRVHHTQYIMRQCFCEVSFWVKVFTISSDAFARSPHEVHGRCLWQTHRSIRSQIRELRSSVHRSMGTGNSDRSVQVFQHLWIYIMICTVGQIISRFVIPGNCLKSD
jgi:hypothetical protein